MLPSPSPISVRIDNATAAHAIFVGLETESREVAAFAYLDRERRVLGLRHARSEARDAIAVPIRDVAADALAFGAAGVVMAHNHPSGDHTPSAADIALTRKLARTLDALEVRLLDHLIVTPGGFTSFRSSGLL